MKGSSNNTNRRGAAFCACAATVLLACVAASAEEPASAGPRAAIRPSLVRLNPGDTQAFKVILGPQRLSEATVAEGVAWSVNGEEGGSRKWGNIDEDGVYRAPKKTPSQAEVHIRGRVPGAANAHVWATVLLGDGPPQYERVDRWAYPADNGEHLKEPHGITLDNNGDLLITDVGVSRVFRFSPNGKLLGEIGIGPGGHDPGHYDGPRDVVVSEAGLIYVSDVRTGPPRVQVFNRDNEVVYGFGFKGTGPAKVLQTTGMAFRPDGRLLLTDKDNMRVCLFEPTGEFIQAWDEDGDKAGQFNAPHGLVVDGSGDFFVPGRYGPCQKFSRNGDFLFAFAHPDPPDGPTRFLNAAGDQWGNVYLAVSPAKRPGQVPEDPKPVAILKFNNNGDLITTISIADNECSPCGMTVGPDGTLYMVFNRDDEVGVEMYRVR